MKVMLYMALTANGMIARENDETPWSDKEWKNYKDKVNESDAIIIGRKTYELMKTGKEFDKIGKPFTVVISKEKTVREGFVFLDDSKKALELLRKKGFKEVLVCGGGQINSLFMKNGLVDEIYLDVEPIVFGNGVKLFSDSDFEFKLKLLDVNKFSDDEVQLHYSVEK